MTNQGDTGGAEDGDQADAHETVTVTDRVRERLVSRECAGCGRELEYGGRGRPPRFCSQTCRQRGWALRTAAQQLAGGADPRPEVVREVIERTTERTVVRQAPLTAYAASLAAARPATPTRAREWVTTLEELTAQLADPAHALALLHYDHPRLYAALLRAVTALGKAHPGGIDQLAGRHH